MLIEIKVVDKLSPNEIDDLSDILMDVVSNNASVGFLNNLTKEMSISYWNSVFSSLSNQHVLFIAKINHIIIGTVQLVISQSANGLHRAEVSKLLVHSQYQGKAVGSRLMNVLEKYAHDKQISLLTLDTQTGSAAEKFYLKCGWSKSGEIPNYALTPNYELSATSIFYKQLDVN